MIARELTEFFATFAPARRGPRVLRARTTRRSSRTSTRPTGATCWEELRFDDVALQRGPGVRPRARRARRAGARPTRPRAAVLHAHDYPPVEFMRRYFDEYRGLRETIGHVERIGVRSTRARRARAGRRRPALDARAGLRRARERARWTARSLVHHTGRKVVLGARLARGRAARAPCSARCRSSGARRRPPRAAAAPARAVPTCRAARTSRARERSTATRRSRASCATARRRCSTPCPGMADRERLHIAFVIPPFSIGSRRPQHHLPARPAARADGPHVLALARTTRSASARTRAPRCCAATIVEHFAPVAGAGLQGLRRTGTAPTSWSRPAGRRSSRCSSCPACRARAYLVNDHEPEFYPTSVESIWAAETYRQGLYGIAGSPWLRDLYVERYGGDAGHVPVRRRPRRLPPAADRAPPRHGRLLRRAVDAAPRRRARRSSRSPSCTSAAPTCGSCCSATASRSRRRSPTSTSASPTPEQLAWVYSEATVGALPVADELLADPAGDAGLRAAVRRPRAARAPSSVFGDDGPGRAGAVRRRRDRRRARAAARRPRRAGERRSRGGQRVRRGRTPGTSPPSRSRRSCATRSRLREHRAQP